MVRFSEGQMANIVFHELVLKAAEEACYYSLSGQVEYINRLSIAA